MWSKVREIGEALLQAPFGRLDDWDAPLRQIAELTGSEQAQFVGQALTPTGGDSILFHYINDMRPGAEADYFAVGADNPQVNWKVGMQSRPLEIVRDEDYARIADQRAPKDQFTEYLKDYRAYRGAHVTLIAEQDAQFTLALLRDSVTSAEQLEFFQAVTPYAHAAALLQRATELQGFAITADTLDTVGVPTLVLDRDGRVGTMTQSAEAIIRSSAPLDIRGSRLRTWPAAVDRQLQAAILAVLDGRPHEQLVLRADHALADEALIAEIFALPRREWSFGFEPRILVTLRQPHMPNAPAKKLLMDIFQLTHTESEVAMQIADGLDRDEIARRRNSSSGTITTHFKNIFRKTDVRREGALIALLNRILR